MIVITRKLQTNHILIDSPSAKKQGKLQLYLLNTSTRDAYFMDVTDDERYENFYSFDIDSSHLMPGEYEFNVIGDDMSITDSKGIMKII